jgi:hypothetical protein
VSFPVDLLSTGGLRQFLKAGLIETQVATGPNTCSIERLYE